MKKKILILVLILLITGCGKNDSFKGSSIKSTGEHLELTIDLDIKKGSEESYYVYFMPKGTRETDVEKGTMSGYVGPLEIKSDGVLHINMMEDYLLTSILDTTDDATLEVFVTTKEDHLIRNPLNETIELVFYQRKVDEHLTDYYFPVSKLTIPITDEYPDGVLSLPFPDATFVIKLLFEDAKEDDGSYEVSIHWNDPKKPDVLGIYRTGKVARYYNYWDTPFYKNDTLAGRTGKIVVRVFATNEIVEYEGYPKTISFDKDGKCLQGDIVKINMDS